jgi:hypothetical protein
VWGAGSRVSQGCFRVVGCGAFRLGFDGGLGGEAENMSLFAPVVRQVLLSRKSRVGGAGGPPHRSRGAGAAWRRSEGWWGYRRAVALQKLGGVAVATAFETIEHCLCPTGLALDGRRQLEHCAEAASPTGSLSRRGGVS